MKPKSEALAFRIWAYCEPRGWACTPGEIGKALGVHHNSVSRVCQLKNWLGRLSSKNETGRLTGANGDYWSTRPNAAPRSLNHSQLHDLGVL